MLRATRRRRRLSPICLRIFMEAVGVNVAYSDMLHTANVTRPTRDSPRARKAYSRTGSAAEAVAATVWRLAATRAQPADGGRSSALVAQSDADRARSRRPFPCPHLWLRPHPQVRARIDGTVYRRLGTGHPRKPARSVVALPVHWRARDGEAVDRFRTPRCRVLRVGPSARPRLATARELRTFRDDLKPILPVVTEGVRPRQRMTPRPQHLASPDARSR